MNLMDLFIKVGVDDQASSKIGKITGAVGKGLATAAKVGTAAIGVAAAGITALTKASIDQYAEYEQLVGGVDTLFKSSSRKVQQYADDAYKTAGLSANEYMETVTSFSASLLQSLGGDTEAAADYADQAIRDMSDNANKMGTDVSMIQTAYQGFAKQNYTMLDNLKLGYGGTAAEMYRLLERAAELDETFAQTANFSLDPNGHLNAEFADITQAIHIVQSEMGITGTTAFEAGRTISGSVRSMKSAWKNLITGLADGNADVESLIKDLVTTIVGDGTESNLGVIGNILPAIETALGGVAQLIEGAAPKVIEILPGLVERIVPSLISAATEMANSVIDVLPSLLETVVAALVENGPLLIAAAVKLVEQLIKGIRDNYQILVDGAIGIVGTLANGILNLLPDIVALGLDLIVSFANGISENLPELTQTIVNVILKIVNVLTAPEQLGALLDVALILILELAKGIISAIPQLIDAAVKIISNLIDFILDENNLNDIIDTAIEIIMAISDGLIKAIPQLVDAAVKIIEKLCEYFLNPENIKLILEMAFKLVVAIANGLIKALSALDSGVKSLITRVFKIFKETDWAGLGKNLVNWIGDGLKSMIENARKWGKDLIDNFIGGIKEKAEALKNTVSNVASSVKDFLGFSEPKKGPLSNFHTYAPDMMGLFIKGIKDNEKKLTSQIEKTFDFGEKTIAAGFDFWNSKNAGIGANGNNISVVQNIYSEAKTAADLMQEALYLQERAVFLGV